MLLNPTFSRTTQLESSISFVDPTNVPMNFGRNFNSNDHYAASSACGAGIGFLLFGTLGLLIPLLNKLSTARFAELNETSARMFSMVAIWLSVAMILAFGVLRLHWTGTAAMLIMLVLVALICGSTTVCTALVFGWKHWSQETASIVAPDKDMA